MTILSNTAIDHDGLMQAKLASAFGERDAGPRRASIREMRADVASLNESHAMAKGRSAIRGDITSLRARIPRNRCVTAVRAAVDHDGTGRLQRRAGPPHGPAVAAGLDVAGPEGSRIRSSTTLIDPPAT